MAPETVPTLGFTLICQSQMQDLVTSPCAPWMHMEHSAEQNGQVHMPHVSAPRFPGSSGTTALCDPSSPEGLHHPTSQMQQVSPECETGSGSNRGGALEGPPKTEAGQPQITQTPVALIMSLGPRNL